MQEPLIDVVRLDLRCDRSLARLTRAALDGVGGIDAIREDARLVASELTTNAVLHSGCTPAHTIGVRIRLNPSVLELSVHDPGLSRDEPRPQPRGARAVGGLGLVLVERLSLSWGVVHGDGRLVWA